MATGTGVGMTCPLARVAQRSGSIASNDSSKVEHDRLRYDMNLYKMKNQKLQNLI